MTTDPRGILTRPAPAPTRSVRLGSDAHEVYDVYEPLPLTGSLADTQAPHAEAAIEDAMAAIDVEHATAAGGAGDHATDAGAAIDHATDAVGKADHATDASGAVDVVLIHGGFWRSGYDRTHLHPLAAALAGEGHRVFLPEYRGTGTDGGGWPTTFDDVTEAVRRLTRDEQCERWVAVGHSAGGHLALWLSHHHDLHHSVLDHDDPHQNEPDHHSPHQNDPDQTDSDQSDSDQNDLHGLVGVISLAGVLDLGLAAELDLDQGAVRDLLGDHPRALPELAARTDPALMGPAPVPVVVIHGSADHTVPMQVSRSWFDRAALPTRDRWVRIEGAEHFGLIDPDHPAHPQLRASLASFSDPASIPRGGQR